MRISRRDLVQLATAATAATALPGRPAEAAIVTPDPIGARITASGIRVELIDHVTPPRSSSAKPYARLNFMYHAGDGSGRTFVNDTQGKIWTIPRGQTTTRLLLDVRAARGSAFYGGGGQTGLRSFAFHPDFGRAGRPGYRLLYTVSSERTSSRTARSKLFEGPFTAAFDNVVAEWRVSTGQPLRADPRSRREVLRIAQPKGDHCTDQLMFDPNLAPGAAGYGLLYITVGDGGNSPTKPDRYDQGQATGRALGKVLCIDPLRRPDRPYAVPVSNPFVGRPGYLPEIWALGLRHPQNLSFDQGGTGRMILTDIGQAQIEEVNLGVAGANYGWQPREGTFATSRFDQTTLFDLPSNDASFGYAYPVAQYDHDEGRAIAGGFVYRGTAVPRLVGHYLFGDIVNGRVFHVPVAELALGRRAVIKELTLLRAGRVVTLAALVRGKDGRVDLRFGQDEAGEVFVLTKQDGRIRRLRAAPAAVA